MRKRLRLSLAASMALGFAPSAYGFSTIPWRGVPARIPNSTQIKIEVDDQYGSYFADGGCDRAGTCKTPFTAIKNAIHEWEAVPSLELKFSSIVSKTISNTVTFDGKNQVKIIHSGWSSQPGNPPASALAVTISTYRDPQDIVDFDIIINSDNQRWADVNDSSEYGFHDIQSVATHEIGHGLGLDHSSINAREGIEELRDATMFFAAGVGETHQRSLGQDDIHGITHLYTTQNFSKPRLSEIIPERLDASTQSRNIIEIHGQGFLPTTAVYILQNQSANDVVGRILNVESDKIEVAFDLSYLPTGTYSILVANAYDKFEKMEDVLEIFNPNGITLGNPEYLSVSQKGCQSTGSGSTAPMILFVTGFFIFFYRRKFVILYS
ncbi:MAG: matrixin family metalloprotease [Bdellovibrionota bacterium]